jgi:hypothetical protein
MLIEGKNVMNDGTQREIKVKVFDPSVKVKSILK